MKAFISKSQAFTVAQIQRQYRQLYFTDQYSSHTFRTEMVYTMLFLLICLCYHNKQFGAARHVLLEFKVIKSHNMKIRGCGPNFPSGKF